MKLKFIALLSTILIINSFIRLQAQFVNTPEIKRKDSVILADIINPSVIKAKQENQTPEWVLLGENITGKYNADYADRTITKAKIYYYYSKDWPLFCTALVHYTDRYEPKTDVKLMNKNAKMILQYSTNQVELKAAFGWSIIAINADPGNAAYKETYEALKAKMH